MLKVILQAEKNWCQMEKTYMKARIALEKVDFFLAYFGESTTVGVTLNFEVVKGAP